MRQTYPNTATGMMDAKQMIPIAGITMGALRSQHVAAYQMASFMRPENQHKFQAVIHDVATTSPHTVCSQGYARDTCGRRGSG